MVRFFFLFLLLFTRHVVVIVTNRRYLDCGSFQPAVKEA